MKSEVIIDEYRCNGCGYCIQFCPVQCLERGMDRISPLGYPLPVVAEPDKCTACEICANMCPRWAIEVNKYPEDREKLGINKRTASLTLDPPLSGCPGCQHPTVGRIVTEVMDEMGIRDKVLALESIPCSISSVFGMNSGSALAYNESATDVATEIKRGKPDVPVIVVLGYWGLSDFSFDVSAFIGAMIRGEKITVILCNMPFYGPKDGRPGPANEPIEGRLEPATRINTPEGQKLLVGGYPLHVAELVATFEGVAYAARGAITSIKDYQQTKRYVKTALQNQMNHSGLSFVEVLCACCDSTFSAPVDSLDWIKEKMLGEFPLGGYK